METEIEFPRKKCKQVINNIGLLIMIAIELLHWLFLSQDTSANFGANTAQVKYTLS